MGVVVTTEELASRAWGPFHGFAGVSYKPLWDGTADRWGPGLVRIEQGASIPRHTHRHSVHHIWILEGRCWMRGRALEAGSYAYVPAGVEHAVHEAGADGCTMLYLYLPADEAGERS
jgi:quercetin dioxygenase-like cupin family protein